MPRKDDTLYPDADLHNADWTKGTWDLLHVDSPQALDQHLAAHHTTADHFMTLPLFRRNVGKLPWLAAWATQRRGPHLVVRGRRS